MLKKGVVHSVKDDAVERLLNELERLQNITGLGYELSVKWCPNSFSNLSGKVESGMIFIFEENAEKALDTLKHEFIDYAISLAIQPYERVTILYSTMINGLMKKLSQQAYEEKEKIVESLKKLV
jgi:hypothetical protein